MSSTSTQRNQAFKAGGVIVKGHAVKIGADREHVVECMSERIQHDRSHRQFGTTYELRCTYNKCNLLELLFGARVDELRDLDRCKICPEKPSIIRRR